MVGSKLQKKVTVKNKMNDGTLSVCEELCCDFVGDKEWSWSDVLKSRHLFV